MNSLKKDALQICVNAQTASREMFLIATETKNNILNEVSNLLIANKNKIIEANKIDIDNARNKGFDTAKIDRLILNEDKIVAIARSIEAIISLPDPVGKVSFETNRESGLKIQRISTPIGVMFAIYESRPNVTADVASLAIKSGNVAILRCGSEAFNSSQIIASFFQKALNKFNVNENAVTFCNISDRDFVKEILKMDKFIDVVIPRGSKSLIKAISRQTKIPIFKHLDGNCHTYINEFADFNKARKILLNAKMRRVSICGATESLLIDKKIAKKIIPLIVDDLSAQGCEVRGDKSSQKIDNRIKKASNQDYYTEYLDKILSLKIVNNIDEAISHIHKYGSSHTESIVTENKIMAQKFLTEVNSAIVMHNASTQFADGGEFGFGAEVGIATGKLHARGPVGLEQLTTYKYIISAECALRK